MLLDKLLQDLNDALKGHDKLSVSTLRFLIAAIKKFEIDTYPPGSDGSLTDEDVVRVIRRQVKTHQESIDAFKKGSRQDLVDKETAELKILEAYLPQQFSDAAITQVVTKLVKSGVLDFGPLMGRVMEEVKDRAPGKRVQEIVKLVLSQKND